MSEETQQLDQLANYIRQSRSMHVSDHEIARGLTHASWSIKTIKLAFQSLKKSPIIEVRELFKEFRLSEDITVHALNGIYHLDIYEGEFLSISGQSGSGKSTLLNILGMIDTPTRGTVLIGGVNIADMNEKVRTHYRLKTLGYVFQFFNLLENYTAMENIMFQLKLTGMRHSKAKLKAMEILQFLGLADRAGSYPSELSGGQQQRIAIGRAIAKDSPILFADEPTAHLDTHNAEKVIELLRQVNTAFGKTVVLVTHEPTYAKMADRIVYLVDGTISKIEETTIPQVDWVELENELRGAVAHATPRNPDAEQNNVEHSIQHPQRSDDETRIP